MRIETNNPLLQKPDFERIRETAEGKRELRELKKATQQVEAIFLKHLVSEMRKGASDGMLGKGFEAQIYADMFDAGVAEAMSKGRGIGIGDLLYRRMEETALARVAAKMPGPQQTNQSNQEKQ
jgi:flagellar protein FlgJ